MNGVKRMVRKCGRTFDAGAFGVQRCGRKDGHGGRCAVKIHGIWRR